MRNPVVADVGDLAALIERAATVLPSTEAVVGSTRRWTWTEAHAAVVHIADELHRIGVRPGQHVAVHRTKTAESLLAVWGVLHAGAVVVPIDAQLAPDITAGMFERAEVVAALVDRRTSGRLPPGLPSIDVSAVVEAAPAEATIGRRT